VEQTIGMHYVTLIHQCNALEAAVNSSEHLPALLQSSCRRWIVCARHWCETVVFVHHSGGDKPPEGGHEAASVHVISDMPTIVDLAQHILHSWPRHLLLCFVQEAGQPHHAALQVRLVEAVGYVPSNAAELAPLLNHSVKEGKGEEQLLPGGGLGRAGGLEWLGGHVSIRPGDIGLHALRRFACQLDAAPQYGGGEVWAGHGTEPEAEIRVHPAVSLFLPHLALGQLFYNARQSACIATPLPKLH